MNLKELNNQQLNARVAIIKDSLRDLSAEQADLMQALVSIQVELESRRSKEESEEVE